MDFVKDHEQLHDLNISGKSKEGVSLGAVHSHSQAVCQGVLDLV